MHNSSIILVTLKPVKIFSRNVYFTVFPVSSNNDLTVFSGGCTRMRDNPLSVYLPSFTFPVGEDFSYEYCISRRGCTPTCRKTLQFTKPLVSAVVICCYRIDCELCNYFWTFQGLMISCILIGYFVNIC